MKGERFGPHSIHVGFPIGEDGNDYAFDRLNRVTVRFPNKEANDLAIPAPTAIRIAYMPWPVFVAADFTAATVLAATGAPYGSQRISLRSQLLLPLPCHFFADSIAPFRVGQGRLTEDHR